MKDNRFNKFKKFLEENYNNELSNLIWDLEDDPEKLPEIKIHSREDHSYYDSYDSREGYEDIILYDSSLDLYIKIEHDLSSYGDGDYVNMVQVIPSEKTIKVFEEI